MCIGAGEEASVIKVGWRPPSYLIFHWKRIFESHLADLWKRQLRAQQWPQKCIMSALEMETWRLKTNRGVSSYRCGCWMAASVQKTNCRSSEERRAVGGSSGGEVVPHHGAEKNGTRECLSWWCFFAFIPFPHFLSKKILLATLSAAGPEGPSLQHRAAAALPKI